MRRLSNRAKTSIASQGKDLAIVFYLLQSYSLFKEFVTTPPSVSLKKTGNIRYNLSFATLALPCFNELYESFYYDSSLLPKQNFIPNNIAEYIILVRLVF